MKAKRPPKRTIRGIELPLSRGKRALISRQDLPLLRQHNWSAIQTRYGRWYAVSRIDGRLTYMHQFLGFRNGDHANGDGLDNRRENLRHATPSQNMANQPKRRRHAGVTPTSQYKGVSRNGSGWMACCGPHTINRYLGTYRTEEEAAEAYNRRAAELWGEFARLNVVA